MANEETGITWAKFTAHGNTRFLKIILTVKGKGIGESNDESLDQYENRHRLAHLGICPYSLSMLYRQRLLDGVLNHFAERLSGSKNLFYVQGGA